jgi:hypothetical protein
MMTRVIPFVMAAFFATPPASFARVPPANPVQASAGEKPVQSGIEKSATSKAALVKAINDSIAYCDRVLTGMDDKKGAEVTKFFTGPSTRLGVHAFNNAHSYEHYSNLVTCMRLKGIVPPSSGGNESLSSLGLSIHRLELPAVCATFWRIGERMAAESPDRPITR